MLYMLVEHWQAILVAMASLVGSLWGLAKIIAPFTETKLDDKLAGALSKVHSVLGSILGLKKA